MAIKDRLTKFLAITGTILACIPVLLPVFFWVFTASRDRPRNFDFILPAEFFPLALIGAFLLYWAARRARSHHRLIGWSLLVAITSLGSGQALAVVTGLADGSREPAGLFCVLVIASIAIYILTLFFLAAEGILLINSLFRPEKPHQPQPSPAA